MTVFIIDFDLTITSQHTHNLLSEEEDVEKHWEIIKNVLPIGSVQEWFNIFTTLLNNGHKVGVVSFNAYPQYISRYLKEVIGLSPEVFQYICVFSWTPKNPGTANKNEHIAATLTHLEYNQSIDGDVVVVDDHLRNINAAMTLGYRTVLATKTGAHLNTILELSTEKPRAVASSYLSPIASKPVLQPLSKSGGFSRSVLPDNRGDFKGIAKQLFPPERPEGNEAPRL
jgi:hypothetical protein